MDVGLYAQNRAWTLECSRRNYRGLQVFVHEPDQCYRQSQLACLGNSRPLQFGTLATRSADPNLEAWNCAARDERVMRREGRLSLQGKWTYIKSLRASDDFSHIRSSIGSN